MEITHIVRSLFYASVTGLRVSTYVFVIKTLGTTVFGLSPLKITEYFKQVKVHDRAQKIAKLCKDSEWCQMVDT